MSAETNKLNRKKKFTSAQKNISESVREKFDSGGALNLIWAQTNAIKKNVTVQIA